MDRIGDVLFQDPSGRADRLDPFQGGPKVLTRKAQLFAEPLQIDQRRTQVVGHAVNEHLIFLLPLPQRTGHIAENGVQARDLVAAGQRPRQLLLLPPAAHVLRQPGEAAGHVPTELQGDDQGQHDRQGHAGADQPVLPLPRGGEGIHAQPVQALLFLKEVIEVFPHGIEIGLGLPGLDIRGRPIGMARGDQVVLFTEIDPQTIRLRCCFRHAGLLRGVVRDEVAQ